MCLICKRLPAAVGLQHLGVPLIHVHRRRIGNRCTPPLLKDVSEESVRAKPPGTAQIYPSGMSS